MLRKTLRHRNFHQREKNAGKSSRTFPSAEILDIRRNFFLRNSRNLEILVDERVGSARLDFILVSVAQLRATASKNI
jgi:hypothetical protein